MARKSNNEIIENEEVVDKKSNKDELVKITKNTLTVFRKKSELNEYLEKGWYINNDN